MQKLQTLLSIAIALVFVFFIGYGIELAEPSVSWNDFCEHIRPAPVVEDKIEVEQEINEESIIQEKHQFSLCETKYESADLKHDRTTFIVALITGIIAIITASFIKHKAVSQGLFAGGILTILYGTLTFWEHAHNWLKFILLGITLALLIYLGYKKIK